MKMKKKKRITKTQYIENNATVLNFGGHAPNRTGMEGFAILCVTIPPRGQNYLKID